MGFSSTRTYVDAIDNGKTQVSSFRKVLTATTVNRIWCDLSMGGGNPVPNFYASSPLVSAVLDTRDGIYHGQNVTPATKHLTRLMLLTNSAALAPSTQILCDYLMFYPFVDMDETAEQVLTNTITLPRYADGVGVRAMLVSQGAFIGGASFFVNYTNQNGVAGRISQTCVSNTSTFTSSLISCGNLGVANGFGPFIPLQTGDTGMRSIESITFNSPNGGIAALVLVKALATTTLREVAAPMEEDFLSSLPSLPRVVDGANLNFLVLPSGNIAGAVFTGLADFTWS